MLNNFLKKYILGIGYPWLMGVDENIAVALSETQMGFSPVTLFFPTELWNKEVPRYRLVLELIDENEKED